VELLETSAWRIYITFFICFCLNITGRAQSEATSVKETADPSWAEVKEARRGKVTAYWYESRPFIYRDANGKMGGIEHDLVEGFRVFIKEKYGIDLAINWREADSFNDTYSTFRDKKPYVTFGISAFSKTEKRTQVVDFSPPYMADICVLITSEDIPILKDISELNAILPRLTAITIKGTTYEQDLMRLQTQGQLSFNMEYIPSSSNIMHTIAKTDSAFGFIDLPVYMMIFNQDPSVKVKRQNFLPIKREGYAIILRKNSDWSIPMDEFFNDSHFKSQLEKIIAQYIDLDLYHFVEGLAVQSDDEMVSLLTKEKEIQYKGLLGKTQQVIEETRMRNFLMALLGLILVFLVIIILLYRKRIEQKDEIEQQRKKLEIKTAQVEQRNQHLLSLDEEKNNLIKILAHDLRTPITQIQGLAQLVLMENGALNEEQKNFIHKITDSAQRLTRMITHLLDIDALENNRVTMFSEDVNISKLVHQVTASFDRQAQKKDIPLSFASACETCMIKGDSIFLIQILENLLSNAIKFSNSGQPISVSVSGNDKKVFITIKDSGPGLTQEDKENLFKKFQRLSTRPTAGEGSFGLGLSIVKKYTELMGGKVSCESRIDEGSAFVLEFDKVLEQKTT
jgi:signal transduction histidine kinase